MEENQINQNQGENLSSPITEGESGQAAPIISGNSALEGENTPPVILEKEENLPPVVSPTTSAPIQAENKNAVSETTEPIVEFTDISVKQEPSVQEKKNDEVAEQIISNEPVLNSAISAINPENKDFNDGKAVLLVEDDAFLNSLLKNKLEKSGVSVNLVTDGEEALKVLETFKPKLVLLDLILPKRSGFEVLEAMQSNPQLNQIPVIILSNLGQESDVTKGRQLGAIEYFIKAKTSIDELVIKVEGYLEGKQ